MGGRTHPCQGARSRVEHPRRNLEPPVRSRSRLATAQINRTGSFDLLMDVDMPASPGMPAIENFSNFGPVGVASPCCTTPSVRTRDWPGEPRSRPIGGSGNQIMGGMPPMI
nr:hypothetical protein [Novosphingobium sp. KA1]